jgi:RNA polymerase sigma-70 factor (ECF subfamily)
VHPDDQSLITECLGGNPAAFGALVSRYQDRLYNTVYRLVENPDDASDVVQEAFLSAYLSLGHFKGDAQFFTWLYRIAVNAAITHRRRQRTGMKPIKTSDSAPGVEPLDLAASNRPGHALEMAEDERQIHEALQRLSPEHRAVLVMKDMDDMKYEDIAEVLKVPIGTIRSRLHRARLEFKDLLERDDKKVNRGPRP